MKFKLYLIELECFEVLRDVLILCGLFWKDVDLVWILKFVYFIKFI